MENTTRKLINDVLNVLKLPLYHISAFRFQEMEFLRDHTTVYQVDGTPDFQQITLRNHENFPVGSISIRSVSQTIDTPPVCRDGEWMELSPVLVLTGSADTWTRCHEICHLLSIGAYAPLPENCFYHCFGICEFFYQSQSGQLRRRTFNGHNGINELLTDYAAWHFMCTLYGEVSPFYAGTEHFGKYADTLFGDNARPETLIGWYFSGNTRKISEFLLGSGYKDYESLYRALFE